ncbi:uncharacterized protein LOC143462488 [Clavelina lepadiformis]|uniref:uncharacterized protein LOC143462488 n=1 Tax=Clavelina lepadiformis TaxID=159417 RepID=UPI0040434E40
MDEFPDAKVILTVRDEDSWYKSWINQTAMVNGNIFLKCMQTFTPTGRSYFYFLRRFTEVIHGAYVSSTWGNLRLIETITRTKYRQHNSDVIMVKLYYLTCLS